MLFYTLIKKSEKAEAVFIFCRGQIVLSFWTASKKWDPIPDYPAMVRKENPMKDLYYKMELAFFEGNVKQGLEAAAAILPDLDLDDDDDLETLGEMAVCGLFHASCVEMVDLLQEHRLDANLIWPNQDNLILKMINTHCYSQEIFLRLLEWGTDPGAAGRNGQTILHILAEQQQPIWGQGPEEFVCWLLNQIEDVSLFEKPDCYGAYPLHYAALREKESILRVLLEKGAAVDVLGSTACNGYSHCITFDHVTPLMLACRQGNGEAVRLLMEYGASPSVTDSAGRCAAFYAVMEPDHHYDPYWDRGIPNQEAVCEAKKEILRLLDTPNALDEQGQTPLLYALSQKSFAIKELSSELLAQGADAGLTDHRGRTPLMLAAGSGFQKAVKELVLAGADKNAQDQEGKTALHHALTWRYEQTAAYLVKKGANCHLADNSGKTPMDLAGEYGFAYLLEKMLESDADSSH